MMRALLRYEMCVSVRASIEFEVSAFLTHGHEQVVKTCRAALKTAQDADDESSASLISDRMRIHEKTAWMLRALNK